MDDDDVDEKKMATEQTQSALDDTRHNWLSEGRNAFLRYTDRRFRQPFDIATDFVSPAFVAPALCEHFFANGF